MEISDDLFFELERKMSYDDFSASQIKRKGYVCPANPFNPQFAGKSAAEVCPTCEHFKNDCIVYGRKAGRY